MLASTPTSTSSLMSLRSTISAGVIDDGAVLLDLESKYFYVLNGTGWAVTRLFESGASVDDALRAARKWGAPDDASVAAFIEQLKEFDFLEPAGSQETAEDAPWNGPWTAPTVERQAEPLQNVMVTAFDPSIPLAE
jgi:hypothetical protein